MNTKIIIGLIVVIGIIVLIAVWLQKTPTSPVEPVVSPVTTTTQTPPANTASTTPAQSTAPATPSSSTAKLGQKIISTKTINGMKIEVTKEGTGLPITNGQTAEMLYTGTLADGTVFDSTANRGNQTFSFSLGSGQVIKGWDQGIVGMKVGEQRTLTIPPELAYGAAGHPPVIPQNATLIFEVTLVGIK